MIIVLDNPWDSLFWVDKTIRNVLDSIRTWPDSYNEKRVKYLFNVRFEVLNRCLNGIN